MNPKIVYGSLIVIIILLVGILVLMAYSTQQIAASLPTAQVTFTPDMTVINLWSN